MNRTGKPCPSGPGGSHEIANRGAGNIATSEREARCEQLTADIAEEIEAYRRRCRDRKYTGWSNASREPIRYAD